MSNAGRYSAIETLRSGQQIEIRALRPEDREALLAAVRRASSQSLFGRFFAAKRTFSEREISFFLNIDFASHVALVGVVQEEGKPAIAASARYIVSEPGKAEMAFAVIDAYQAQGIGTKLLQHLIAIAREAGLRELTADVLPENTPMLAVFERSGFPCSRKREPRVVHVTLHLA